MKKNDNVDCTKEHRNPYRILSYCYGYGGLDKGVERVISTRTTAFVEIEAFQNFNLVAAMESGLVDKAPIWTNLKTFDASPFRGKIHGIIGGYPCQGESLAGNRKLSNDPRFLWPYISETIRTVRPLFCFFENVGGHLTGSFPLVLESLQSLGYKVEAGLFTASEVGAPHKRERLFILAIDRNAQQSELRELVAYTSSGNGSNKQERKQSEVSITKGCSAMADTKSVLLQGCGSRQGQEQSGGSGTQLANATSIRNGESSQEHQTGQFNKESNQWPARPGQQQNECEEPRTIEPGMGCTVNGYNFRTELLRQYGNGVVSQQAEKAFRELMNQIIKEL